MLERHGDSSLAIFTSPSGTDLAALARARCVRAQRIVGGFLRRRGEAIGEPLAGQLACLPDFAGAHPVQSDRALTSLAAALTSPEADPTAAAARALLLLLTAGADLAAADIVLERPARLGWHDHLLPKARRVVSATHERVELDLAGSGGNSASGDRQVFRRGELGGDPRAVALPRIDAMCVIAPWAVDTYASIHVPFALSPLPIDDIVAPLRDAWHLIELASPETFQWCGRVATDVVALAGDLGTSRSGSNRDAPGQLALSVPASPLTLAELFVHECSHQYFHLVEELGPVDDGSDSTLHWSPLTRSERPLDRILIAHHAVANIIRFYRAVAARGLDVDGHAEAELDRQTVCLHALETALEKTGALTEHGRALYTPAALLDVRIPPALHAIKEN
jgi:HEXXH motif-containing protein